MSYTIDDNRLILSPLEQTIKNKIEIIGTPLSKWNIRINRGLLTGLNDAFIISKKKREELIAEDPKSAEIIRPINQDSLDTLLKLKQLLDVGAITQDEFDLEKKKLL